MITARYRKRIGYYLGNTMASNLVNLDALIAREDWDAMPDQPSWDTQSPSGVSFKCIELEKTGLGFQLVKKPEFQRETASWTPDKVVDLIRCFVEGDLIPSIIIWRNEKSKNLFVIDGAHRLGALIAWVHDDYGNGDLSRKYFNGKIPPEQIKSAKLTRDRVNGEIGAYESIKKWDLKSDTKEAGYAAMLFRRSLNVQEIGGGSKKAEDAFFKINQKAAPITPTELNLIGSRKKAHGIATRAIVRAGVGHKYWKQFPDEIQNKVENIASDVYSLLFKPPLSNPIPAGLNLPIGGRGYSEETISLSSAFVNAVIAPPQKKAKTKDEPVIPADDKDGVATLALLEDVRRLAMRMAGNTHPSLGLHAAVYFYSATGRFQPTSFLATASLIRELEKEEKFLWFTLHRERFEAFWIEHRYLINQIVIKFGSMEKSHQPMLELYRTVLMLVANGQTDKEIMAEITAKFVYLREQSANDFAATNADFSYWMKNAVIRKAGIAKLFVCGICGAPIHPNAISWDHTEDKKNGGLGQIENGQPTHPFCNMNKDQLLPLFKGA